MDEPGLSSETLQGVADALRAALQTANERVAALEAELPPLKEKRAGLERALAALERAPSKRDTSMRNRYVQARPVGSVVQALREWAANHEGIVDARALSEASGIDGRGVAGAVHGLVRTGEFIKTASGLYRCVERSCREEQKGQAA